MKKRSKVSGARVRARRPMAKKLTRRDAPKSVPSLKSSPRGDETEVVRLTRELKEALEQQNATSEVLQVISGSPSDLEPVFNTMLEKAVRICGASFGNIYRWDGEALNIVASYNTAAAFAEQRRKEPFRPRPINPVGQMIESKKTVHVHNMAETEAYLSGDPVAVASVKIAGARTGLAVPMLKDNELIGAFTLGRQEIRDFSERQIALVTNFANQAVIAIENARLLNELRESNADLRQRTNDLTEALEQQTATSEVLQIISSSLSDFERVLATILEKAVRICGAKIGNVYLWDGEALRVAASNNTPSNYAAVTRMAFRPNVDKSAVGRMIANKAVVQIADMRVGENYLAGDPRAVAAVELGGVRTLLAVPMLKENDLVGAFVLSRQEVRPFTEKQVELIKNFAAHAVIAIENARLLNELRQSLEQQTATAEVLGVISSASGDLEPVFAAMLEKAIAICNAKFGSLFRFDGKTFRPAVQVGAPSVLIEAQKRQGGPVPGSLLDRVMKTKQVQYTANAAADPFPGLAARYASAKSIVGVPILKDASLVGAILVYRQEVRPFGDKQIELLKNFANQAVIAIENARLLNELRERTGQLEMQSQEVVKLNQQLEQRVSDQVGEIERMGRLRRFLPPQVADLIVASGAEKQLESHRREITALFCDLRGFTGFSESSDPEDVMALLRDYHAAIGEIIIKYSGTLERYAGDGVMVVFNDPVPVDNPALQAVLMALKMRDAIGNLTETWRRWGHDIGFGIGIAHGFATLGTIGFEGRFDYAAIGTVSNVASRLCDEAKPGQILISPRVLTQVESAVKVEPVGEFELKGIRRPLAAYNVVAAKSAN
jgi:GAF domain-containing protein